MKWLDFLSLDFWLGLLDVRLYLGGGGGGEDARLGNWSGHLEGPWLGVINRAIGDSEQPYQSFFNATGRSRTPGVNQDQRDSMQFTRNMANASSNPLGSMNGARSQIEGTLGGDYLGANPYAQGGNEFNPWTHQFRNEQAGMQNQYGGMESPYFRQSVQQGIDDMTAGYQRGTAAETTRSAAMNKAFGGMAHQNAIANNEAGLAKGIGNYITGRQETQYNRSGEMDEARIGRMTNAQEGLLTRGNQSFNAGQDRGANAWMNERGNMMGAIGSGQNEQNLAYQRIGGLMGIGDFQRGVEGQQNEEMYNNWFDQRNYNKNNTAWLASILSGAQGGLPASQMQAQASPWANAIGTGLAAYGMFRS